MLDSGCHCVYASPAQSRKLQSLHPIGKPVPVGFSYSKGGLYSTNTASVLPAPLPTTYMPCAAHCSCKQAQSSQLQPEQDDNRYLLGSTVCPAWPPQKPPTLALVC